MSKEMSKEMSGVILHIDTAINRLRYRADLEDKMVTDILKYMESQSTDKHEYKDMIMKYQELFSQQELKEFEDKCELGTRTTGEDEVKKTKDMNDAQGLELSWRREMARVVIECCKDVVTLDEAVLKYNDKYKDNGLKTYLRVSTIANLGWDLSDGLLRIWLRDAE